MANNLPAIVSVPAAADEKQMPEVASGEDMASFMSRCVADETMMAQHPNATDRMTACQVLWADDQMESEPGDMAMNDGIIPPEHRAVPPAVVFFNDVTARKQRVGKPNSQVGADGKRHSVRLIKP